MLSHDAPGAIHGEPLLACPDGQVLPQAKEADHTQAIEGEAMQANSDNTQLRIMHIMSSARYYWNLLRLWLSNRFTRKPAPGKDTMEACQCL